MSIRRTIQRPNLSSNYESSFHLTQLIRWPLAHSHDDENRLTNQNVFCYESRLKIPVGQSCYV